MRAKHLTAAAKWLGIGNTVKLFTSRRRLMSWLPDWTQELAVPGFAHRFRYRHGTTDKYVIAEVLIEREYDDLLGLDNIRTIFDVGANIGATSVLLLNAYPNARVIALEPDRRNFEALTRNLEPYGARAVPLRLALWPRSEGLEFGREKYREGGEWAIQVQAVAADRQAEVEGITLADLMKRYDVDTVDILKIDIEGAERYVFESPLADCLARVRYIAIELHDEPARDAFFRSVEPFGGESSGRGAVTFWRHGRLG